MRLILCKVWEFKHPEFQANKKDSLDNIRRKAPAPRKATQSMDESFIPVQQMDLINTQLIATQQQLQHLQQRYDDLCQGHRFLSDQVVFLQKVIKAHDEAMHRVMGFLHGLDAQRRNSNVSGEQFGGGGGGGDDNSGMGVGSMIGDDLPASPLQQATQLLGQYSAENLVSKELEQRARGYSFINDYTTPPQDQASSGMASSSGVSNIDMGYDSLDFDLVYPVGRTNGIDPINSEHINNIPYPIPPNGAMIGGDSERDGTPGTVSTVGRKKNPLDPGWGIHKPRVLLVEDDKTCARIGCKLLQLLECGVETAVRFSSPCASSC
jgi:osomolarity two-component system, response regulator SKN7